MGFVKWTLGRSDAQKHPVRVVLLGRDIARYWHNEIQPHVRQASTHRVRADRRWNWPALLRLLPRVELLAGRRCYGHAVIAKSQAGAAVPVALSLLVERYTLIEQEGPGTFVWFAASAPDEACDRLNIPRLDQLGRILIDAAMVTSVQAGLDGRISLHADPGGDVYLPRYYAETCGLLRVPASTTLCGVRINDGRYFHATPQVAQALLKRFDDQR